MKIAIISNTSHENIGGVENYNRIIMNHWKGKHKITEFPTFVNKNQKGIVSKKIKEIKIDNSLVGKTKPIFNKRNFRKIYDNFDVVLLSCLILPEKWMDHPKSIVVQHLNKTSYSLNKHFKNSKRTVFFAKESSWFTKGKSFYAPLPHKVEKEIVLNNTKRDGFVWLARLNKKQKNLEFAIELANKNPDVSIYGEGEDHAFLDKKLINKKQYGGKVEHNKVDNLLNKTKALLLTSNHEGFGFTVTEALSNGTPVIIFDSFDIVKFFKKCESIFVIKKNDQKSYQETINKLRNMKQKEYRILQQKAIQFAKEKLNKEKFLKTWDQAIETKIGIFENKWPAYELLKNNLLPVLKKEKVWYAAEAGTMMGVVRHKGFIPWDDDIDLMITYEGLKTLQKKYPQNILSTDDKGYPLLFPKWVEDKSMMNSSVPAIDLFIIVPTTEKKVKKWQNLFTIIRFSLQTLNKSKFHAFNWQVKIAKMFQWLLLPHLWKKVSIHKCVEKLTVPIDKAEGYYLIENPLESYYSKFNPITTLNTIEKPFEDIKINIPKDYDEILTHRYVENYMTPHIGKHVFDHKSPISINLLDGEIFKEKK